MLAKVKGVCQSRGFNLLVIPTGEYFKVVCACQSVCLSVCLHLLGAPWRPEEVSDILELKLQVAGKHPVGMLRSE